MFKVSELLEATQGKLISGSRDQLVNDICIDSRNIKKGSAFIAIKGDRFDGHDFIRQAFKKGATCIIAKNSKGLKKGTIIIVKDTIKALGDIARMHRNRFDIPIITVTGSNGKTTTKEMIASVLSGKFKVLKNEGTKNNHIGLPLTLLKLDSSYDIAVLEVGTNHFGEVKYLSSIVRANIGVITNIGLSHLEYFKNLSGVFREKLELIKNLKRPGLAILNADDPFLKKVVYKKSKLPIVIGVGINKESDFTASNIKVSEGKPEFKANRKFRFALNTLGYYNIYNSLLAIAVGRVFGLRYRDIALQLAAFNLPKSRLNFREINKIKFIDDTYNANPVSLKQALEVLKGLTVKGRKILVLGDMLELGKSSQRFHDQSLNDALKSCDTLITVGKFTATSVAKKLFLKKNIFTCKDSFQARDVLYKEIRVAPSDIVLVKGSRSMKMEEVFNT
ncbi:MAG: UDP-N-acetylmuramoyl-tripeptide--D-alanyl-D-alanine ligase [Candidatus Omnitrophica bacterium]|nr:UDP-N-acetylmuramoyl-tripeptide--D-alanyl-D-alanine ligase [Candidatus Omnitrophota bacterium]